MVALLLFLLTCGCASTGMQTRTAPGTNPVYHDMIKEWQMRIHEEGWSEDLVHSILLRFRTVVTYRSEKVDHWDTPREFMERGFFGDCEDIAIFMMGSLKDLGYPYQIRVAIVKAVLEDHAMLRIEMPEGSWALYDVVPASVPVRRPRLFRPVVEFDDTQVRWFASGEWEPVQLSKAD
jgi:hypothetical protein